jgi:uncharacterized protein
MDDGDLEMKRTANTRRPRRPIFVTRSGALSLIIAIMFVGISFSSQSFGAALAPDPEVRPASHPLFLWRVESGGATVYLLGSIHVGGAGLYPLPQEIERAFSRADYLVEETSSSTTDPAAARQFWLTNGRYTDGDRLENHLSDQTKLALSIYLQVTGRSAGALSRAKPWMATLIIDQEELQISGLSKRNGIDSHFGDEAAALGKPIIGLEPPDYQRNLMYWLYSTRSEDFQDKRLLATLLRIRNNSLRMNAMLQVWRAGDVRTMEALIGSQGHDLQSQPYTEEAIYKRSERMAQQIVQYLNTPYTYFVVVGAMHVIGDRGIVKLLEAKGYRVEQLTGY